ncbi:MAG: RHS repeat-associated core domain-containing protein, partial [Ardenticatenales bacterium]|nr:RHS repeat-associated core domain-containing protein [Ardenticatenales bacterium]
MSARLRTTRPIVVSGGQSYDLYAYLRGQGDSDTGAYGTWTIRATFYNSAGAAVGTLDAASGTLASLTTTWARKGSAIVAPATATTAMVELMSMTGSGWVAFDSTSMIATGSGGGSGSMSAPSTQRLTTSDAPAATSIEMPGEMLLDPSFEEGTGWATVVELPDATNVRRYGSGNGQPQSGSFSYVISNQAYGSVLSDPIAAEPQKVYDVHAWLRGQQDTQTGSGGYWIVRARFYDVSDVYLGYTNAQIGQPGTLSTSWQQKGGSISTPAGTASVRLEVFNILTNGWVAMDDVTLNLRQASTKYYYAGAQRIAQRTNARTPVWTIGDHLGSTAFSVDTLGTVSELRYKPWGETRYESGLTPTERRYTGQIQDSADMYFYNARYYDPTLGKFLQADTIVPEPGNPQSWNRYAYTMNNPVKYVDPTGHWTEEELQGFLGEDWYQLYFGKKSVFEGRENLLNFLRSKDTSDRNILYDVSSLMRATAGLHAAGVNVREYDAVGIRLSGSAAASPLFGGAFAEGILNVRSGEYSIFAGIEWGIGLGASGSATAGLVFVKNLPNNSIYRGDFT